MAAGAALVDGGMRPKNHRLEGGEEVRVEVVEPVSKELQAEDIPLPIAYEDEQLLVVDKPAGIVVHPSPGHATGTLVHGLVGRAAGGHEDRPGIVHRLDRDTSGLLVVARSEEAYERLQELVHRVRVPDSLRLGAKEPDVPHAGRGRIGQRSGGSLPPGVAVEWLREERDGR